MAAFEKLVAVSDQRRFLVVWVLGAQRFAVGVLGLAGLGRIRIELGGRELRLERRLAIDARSAWCGRRLGLVLHQ